jgi:hypothetical protein
MLMNGATQNLLGFTSVGYAFDVGFMFVILAILASFVLKREKAIDLEIQRPRLHAKARQNFRHMMISEYAVGALFLVSAAPVFWVPTPIGHLRFVLWYSSFLIFVIRHAASHWKTQS